MGDQAPRSLFSGFQNLKTQRKPVVKVNSDEDQEHRELITGVEGSRIKSAAPVDEQPAGKKVVPKLENTFTVGARKFAPSYIPSSAADAVVGEGEDRFELAAPEEKHEDVQYGLQRRANQADTEQQPAKDFRAIELEKFKKDMEELPEATQDQYEKVGVEEFGMALLRGMGWKEGEGVGRNKKQVDAKEYIRRPDRLGLGAQPVPVKEEKRPLKMGDKPKQNPKDMVLPPSEDGRIRHMKTLDEKLVPREQVMPGPFPGKAMRIIDGRHKGLLCKVLQLLPKEEGRSDRAKVRLHPSDEDVTVRCKELAERWEERNGNGTEQGKPLAPEQERPTSREGRQQEQHRDSTKRKRSRSPAAERLPQQRHSSSPARSSGPCWLHPSIRVRIVDKHVGKGKLYLKKAVVVDVHPGHTCDVSVEESQEVLQLHQDSLETVVPKEPGAAVMVVSGKLKGQKAQLLQVNKANEVAAVKLVSDLSVQRLHLDDIAQYMGHLEEEY